MEKKSRKNFRVDLNEMKLNAERKSKIKKKIENIAFGETKGGETKKRKEIVLEGIKETGGGGGKDSRTNCV